MNGAESDGSEGKLNSLDDIARGLGTKRKSQSLYGKENRESSIKVTGGRASSGTLPAKQDRPTFIISEGSEELEDERTRNRRSKRRFGKEINPRSYQTGQCVRMLAMVMAVLIVPI